MTKTELAELEDRIINPLSIIIMSCDLGIDLDKEYVKKHAYRAVDYIRSLSDKVDLSDHITRP